VDDTASVEAEAAFADPVEEVAGNGMIRESVDETAFVDAEAVTMESVDDTASVETEVR
jgi:hypothetical protein